MSADPGYHIVNAPLDGDWKSFTALQFFRRISQGKEIPEWVIVTGLEELLLYVDADDEAAAISMLNRLLTETGPSSPLAVQFVVDGTVSKDNRVYVEPSRNPEHRIYVDAMFRDPPTQEGANHYWSERA
jgi:hypothetical protein